MNNLNSLVHALKAHGGFATMQQLEAVRPKIKDVLKSSVELVDAGHAVWEEAPDGSQLIRLTNQTLATMSGGARQLTHTQLRALLDAGENLAGQTILVIDG